MSLYTPHIKKSTEGQEKSGERVCSSLFVLLASLGSFCYKDPLL